MSGDGGLGVAGEPAVVMHVDAVQDVSAWGGREEDVIAPVFGEATGEVGVVGMCNEVVAGGGLEAEHSLWVSS